MAQTELSDVAQFLLNQAEKRMVPLEEAASDLVRSGFPEEKVKEAVEEITRRIEALDEVGTAVLSGAPFEPWYPGPRDRGHWARYRQILEAAHAPGLDSLDAETTRITRLLSCPRRTGERRKGLVVGNVQSGKTRNFAGVIAKAADAGYRLVIVLAGMHNNLRDQTQTRLNEQLFVSDDWCPLTSETQDFDHVGHAKQLFLKQDLLCMVVKKNAAVLSKLVEMLDGIGPDVLRRFPTLIVDDEADQASPNTMAPKDEVSAINRLLRQLWGYTRTGTYLAYTATPFANVLMDPDEDDDLFPSDFILAIEPGEGYFGPERVFGVIDSIDADPELPDMVRTIPEEDATVLRPPSKTTDHDDFDPGVPPSLQEAIAWFVLAVAVRWVRGQADQHSSMLVHTTHYKKPHFTMQARIAEFVSRLADRVARGNTDLLRRVWQRESVQLRVEDTGDRVSWQSVAAVIPDVLARIQVKVDNGDSLDRLNYKGGEPQNVIAVGGGTLSRGLTLEGLVVSYFTRSSNTYDTLLQMGRWFGYRTGYEDLPRVWVADGLDQDYAFLARVERELREEIRVLSDGEHTPKDVGVRVRTHPGRLQITNVNKMHAAREVQVGLSGTSNQTFILDGRDGAFARNRDAVERLIEGRTLARVPWGAPRWIVRDVAGGRVIDFLTDFVTHPDQRWLSDPDARELMAKWIRRWAAGESWNVVVASRSMGRNDADELGTVTIGRVELCCLDRSPLKGSTRERLNMKAVLSARDRVADLDPQLLGEMQATDVVAMKRARRNLAPGQGLIVVYPISGNPRNRNRVERADRVPMPSGENLLAFSIFFPHIMDEHGHEGSFVSVRPNRDVNRVTQEGDDD